MSLTCSALEYLPFDRTNLSRLKYVVVCGAYLITYLQSATPIAAMPIAPLPHPSVCHLISAGLHAPWMAAIELLAEVCNQQPESLQYMLLLIRKLLDRGLLFSFFFL
jgi:hypothetical protein